MTTFLGVIAAGAAGYVLCLFVTRVRQEEIRHDRGLIRRWMDDNDKWALAQAELFAAEQPHVTGELVAVADTPALSDQSHEDEQAANEDDSHEGGWRFAIVAAVWGGAELVQSRTPLAWWRLLREHIAAWRASRDRLDGEETPLTEESPHRMGPIEEAEVRRLVESHGESDAEAFEIEVAEIVAAEDRKRKVRYLGRHWAHDTQHTGQFPIVPAQRDGEVA